MNIIEARIKNVANGNFSSYNESFKDTFLYKVIKGKRNMYSYDETMPGVTIEFQNKNEPSTTLVYCDNIKRAIEIVEYQEANKVAIHEQQQAIGNYIRKHKMY